MKMLRVWAALDARRAMVFLMPMKAYEGVLQQAYHLKVSEQAVEPKGWLQRVAETLGRMSAAAIGPGVEGG